MLDAKAIAKSAAFMVAKKKPAVRSVAAAVFASSLLNVARVRARITPPPR